MAGGVDIRKDATGYNPEPMETRTQNVADGGIRKDAAKIACPVQFQTWT